MTEPIHFHADLDRREALVAAARTALELNGETETPAPRRFARPLIPGALLGLGRAPEFQSSTGAGASVMVLRTDDGSDAKVEFRPRNDGTFRVASTSDTTLRDEGLLRGLDPPFGCRMGACGMCCARVVSGRVDQGDRL